MYLPRPATKYPGCYPKYFERHLPEILGTENFVHFFAGTSKLGFRIDTNPEVNPDLLCDVHKVNLPDNYFDAGMADPPYTKEFAENLYGCEYPRWSEWTKELSRLVKPKGLIGVMQNYIVPRIAGCNFEEIIVILLRIKQYPKIVTVQRKQ